MGFFRRIAGFLGFSKDDGHEVKEEEDDGTTDDHHNRAYEPRAPRKGFSVPVQVAVERPQFGPVLAPCNPGEGGIQGLKWYAKQLRIDEDGDVADEFLNEIFPVANTSNMEDQKRKYPKFEVKYSARPAKVRKQIMSLDGRIQHGVEHQGRLQWV